MQENKAPPQGPANDKMTVGEPVCWGTIDAEIAERAAALLEKGERHESQGYMFANIAVGDRGEIRTAKDKVEKVRHAYSPELQGADYVDLGRPKRYLGQSQCDKGVERKSSWRHEWLDAWICRVE